jgi:hypothetical protein
MHFWLGLWRLRVEGRYPRHKARTGNSLRSIHVLPLLKTLALDSSGSRIKKDCMAECAPGESRRRAGFAPGSPSSEARKSDGYCVSLFFSLVFGVISWGCDRIILDFESGGGGRQPEAQGGEGNQAPEPPRAPELHVDRDLDLSSVSPSGRLCSQGGDQAVYRVDGLVDGDLLLTDSPEDECLLPGDEVLLIQLQGTAPAESVGRHELLRVQGISGARLRLVSPPLSTYGIGEVESWESGGGTIVVQRVPSFSRMTVAAGATLTARSWTLGGSGMLALRVLGDLRLDGTISMNGAGVQGGPERPLVLQHGQQGESMVGLGGPSTAANLGGGGGGLGDQTTMGCSQDGKAGGGGGHTTRGEDASVDDLCSSEGRGRGGEAYAVSGKLFLGSGGGSGGVDNVRVDNPPGAPGGNGGGLIWILAQSITGAGSIEARGLDGVGDEPGLECSGGGSQTSCYDHSGPGGGGAGGSIRLSATQLSGLTLDVAGGAGGNGRDDSTGNGGDGASGLLEAPGG